MALPQDPAPKFGQYAHPEKIVSTEWGNSVRVPITRGDSP
jgi:hypothetical protein